MKVLLLMVAMGLAACGSKKSKKSSSPDAKPTTDSADALESSDREEQAERDKLEDAIWSAEVALSGIGITFIVEGSGQELIVRKIQTPSEWRSLATLSKQQRDNLSSCEQSSHDLANMYGTYMERYNGQDERLTARASAHWEPATSLASFCRQRLRVDQAVKLQSILNEAGHITYDLIHINRPLVARYPSYLDELDELSPQQAEDLINASNTVDAYLDLSSRLVEEDALGDTRFVLGNEASLKQQIRGRRTLIKHVSRVLKARSLVEEKQIDSQLNWLARNGICLGNSSHTTVSISSRDSRILEVASALDQLVGDLEEIENSDYAEAPVAVAAAALRQRLVNANRYVQANKHVANIRQAYRSIEDQYGVKLGTRSSSRQIGQLCQESGEDFMDDLETIENEIELARSYRSVHLNYAELNRFERDLRWARCSARNLE